MSQPSRPFARPGTRIAGLFLIVVGCTGCRSVPIKLPRPLKSASAPLADTASSSWGVDSQRLGESKPTFDTTKPASTVPPFTRTEADRDAATTDSLNLAVTTPGQHALFPQPVSLTTRQTPDPAVAERLQSVDASTAANRQAEPIRGPASLPPAAQEYRASLEKVDVPAAETTPPQTSLLVTGVRTAAGPVRLAVFTEPNSFPESGAAAWTGVVEPTQPHVSVVCPQSGQLAVAAFQDLNNDGKLNRNRYGIPLEPYGFSNGAKGDRGPPSFSAAAVDARAFSGRPIPIALP